MAAETVFGSQFILAYATTFILQWLKEKPWFPWISYETEKLNKLVSYTVAFLTGLGVYVVFDKAAGVLTISGLTLANLYHALTHMGGQLVLQQVAYRHIASPPLPGRMQSTDRERK